MLMPINFDEKNVYVQTKTFWILIKKIFTISISYLKLILTDTYTDTDIFNKTDTDICKAYTDIPKIDSDLHEYRTKYPPTHIWVYL